MADDREPSVAQIVEARSGEVDPSIRPRQDIILSISPVDGVETIAVEREGVVESLYRSNDLDEGLDIVEVELSIRPRLVDIDLVDDEIGVGDPRSRCDRDEVYGVVIGVRGTWEVARARALGEVRRQHSPHQ